ncbi:hypothetical protein [Paraglaciecola hydrolytica]|uniref:Uncharacterized protein n=1 Tax=Paraglaciecola hydrolytica TaxID=1799789 RepID=A0A135ZZ14_9ALTE|nr:hypothetical protein [Paraglaciecola hydrolytica]KXI28222.1 hypothetical protein AX660_17745 [Paraglaciecola hydrolytica]
MRTLFFSLIVVISGYYLLNQTDSGNALLSKVMPSQQIEQTTDELLNKVDSRLQDFAHKQSSEQNRKIQQLEQQIKDLSALLANQQAMQQTVQQVAPQKTQKPAETKEFKTAELSSQRVENHELNLPPNVSEIKGQTASYVANTKMNEQSFDTTASKTLQRQKQASLQDIAARMEQVSLQISKGNY